MRNGALSVHVLYRAQLGHTKAHLVILLNGFNDGVAPLNQSHLLSNLQRCSVSLDREEKKACSSHKKSHIHSVLFLHMSPVLHHTLSHLFHEDVRSAPERLLADVGVLRVGVDLGGRSSRNAEDCRLHNVLRLERNMARCAGINDLGMGLRVERKRKTVRK